jgi:hypothetical protein
MKLNPTKCVFGVRSGKLLGFIVSNRGIEANPEKITAITDMGAPAIIKDVQKLTGCMAALNRFISRLGERGLPFFKLLKRQDKFHWTEKAERALQDLKQHLQSPLILTAPLPGEPSYFTLRQLPMLSAVPLLSSAPRKAMRLVCRGLFTSSAKYSQNLTCGTRQSRSFFMAY